MREWALIAFTILAQLSVGAFVVLGVVHTWARARFGPHTADTLADRVLPAIGGALLLGLLASLFHLGAPLSAVRALTNIQSSWLSREIALGSAFAALGALFTLLQWRQLGAPTLRYLLALLTSAVGLSLVYAMARVYMLPTQPAWNTWTTPLAFFLTTFLLGSLALGVALVVEVALLQRRASVAPEVDAVVRGALRGVALTALLALGLEFVVIPLGVALLAAGPAQAVQSAQLMVMTYGWLFGLRLALVFLGAGVFALWLYRSVMQEARAGTLAGLVMAAFALALVGEVIGRFLFYATHVKIGL